MWCHIPVTQALGREAEVGRSPSLRPTWFTYWVPGLCSNTQLWTNRKNKVWIKCFFYLLYSLSTQQIYFYARLFFLEFSTGYKTTFLDHVWREGPGETRIRLTVAVRAVQRAPGSWCHIARLSLAFQIFWDLSGHNWETGMRVLISLLWFPSDSGHCRTTQCPNVWLSCVISQTIFPFPVLHGEFLSLIKTQISDPFFWNFSLPLIN